jgi:putative transposase
MSKSYPTNLTDSEWQPLESYLPTPQKRGRRPRIHGSREIMDAIFYVSKSGRRWRPLPREFPPWETVYHHFGRWSLEMVPGKGCTTPSASACALRSDGLLDPVPQ